MSHLSDDEDAHVPDQALSDEDDAGSLTPSGDHERIADSWRCQPSGTGSKGRLS